MRKRIAFLSAALCTAALFVLCLTAGRVGSAAAEESASFGDLTTAEDGASALLPARFSESFLDLHQEISFFRIPVGCEDLLPILTPTATFPLTEREATFALPCDRSDASSVLYGYLPAVKDEDGRYQPLSDLLYLTDPESFASNAAPYPDVPSKKGLQISLITDAQLLGVRHTVIPVFLNELVTENEDAVSFVYGGSRFRIDRTALAALDYQITTLTKAGVHCYLNLLLSYEPSADPSLYEAGIAPSYGTLCAPDLSSSDALLRYASVVRFLCARYTEDGAPYGFCGSFIVGYEIDRGVSHLSSAPDADSYADACAALIRVTDLAVRSAYRYGRVYVSLSHDWEPSGEEAAASFFGAKDLLAALAARDADIPFGVSIHPYPSSLGMTDFWNDPKATDDPETEFLTMKNLSVFTDLLKTDALRYRGEVRRALIGEFGVSGKYGEESESLQAAAYLLAYEITCENEMIEALIWHRQVDHAGEKDLYFGLWSASDLLWEPQAAKEIHTVMAAADADGQAERRIRENARALLPADVRRDEAASALTRVVYSESPLDGQSALSGSKETLKLDFAKSLYHFYPSDNADYLEPHTEGEETFLRARLFRVSAKEYAGVGGEITDASAIREADAVKVRLRVLSSDKTADVRLLLTGIGGERDVVLDASSAVPCGEWTELTFPLSDLAEEEFSSCRIKIWMRPDSFSLTAQDDLFLDVSSVVFLSSKDRGTLRTVFWILILLAAAAAVFLAVYLLLSHRRRAS